MQPDQFLQLASELKRRADGARLFWYYPDETREIGGKTFHARERYPKHLEFFARGKDTFQRMFMASVGAGKTEALLYELTLHARGWYPDWWPGIRYDRPLDMWVSGKTFETTREILQTKWLGPPDSEMEGLGILPVEWLDKESIVRLSQGSIKSFRVHHVSGGVSRIAFKSYDQGKDKYYGTDQDIVAFDEPCPAAIYAMGVHRTRNRPDARVIYTVAALEGKTETVKMFMDEPDPSRVIVTCSWDEVPHLDEEWKRATLAATPHYLRESTMTGVPSRAQGAVYPIAESEFVIDPIPIPKHWRWIAGFDAGFHNTAGAFIVVDPDSDVAYTVADYKDGGPGTDYQLHVTRLKARARGFGFEAMPFRGDAAAVNQSDGKKLLDLYRAAGLNLQLADKSVAAGIGDVTERLESGRLKVFKTCTKLLDEFRNYSYEFDEESGTLGKIVKVNDHIMDAWRYAIREIKHAKSPTMAAPIRIVTPGVRR